MGIEEGTVADRQAVPGESLDVEKMPGHWLLARLGKRVLRPGGLKLTTRMLEVLDIREADEVVEFAPGLGVTTRMTLERDPASYVAVDRDESAVARIRALLEGTNHECVHGRAQETGLDDAVASVVYGEAMLSMQTPSGKRAIVREARRLLRAGGRYGIHELGLVPDTITEETKATIERDLRESIRVGARPLTRGEWTSLLEEEGFRVLEIHSAPMSLLEPARLIADEGVVGAGRILFNTLSDPAALRRVMHMRRTFRTHASHLNAITLVAVREDDRTRA